MQKIKSILVFSWPFIRPHRHVLLVGVLCGFLFGLSNGAVVWLTRTLLARTDPAAYMAARERPASTAEPTTVSQTGWTHAFKESMERRKRHLTETVDAWVNPWLPVAGNPLTWQQILGVALFLPLFGIFRSFAGFFASYCLAWAGERVITDVRMNVFKNLMHLSLDYFNRSTLGDMITRVDGDTKMLQRTLSHGVEHAVKDPMTLLSVFIMLLILDFQLTLAVLVVMPLMMFPVVALARRAKKAAHKTVATNVVQSSLLIEMLSGIRVVKAFNLEREQTDRFDKLSHYRLKQIMKVVRSQELVSPILESVSLFVVAGVLIFVLQTERNMPDMMAFFLGLYLFYGPVRKLARLHVLFTNTSVGIDRLRNILSEKPSVQDPPAPKPLPTFSSGIEFDNVSFAYADETVLHDFQLSIPRGFKLGIAGESGCGKSTVVNLLFRFFDPVQGRILIDGADIREVAMADLRSHMALVSQDIVIFDKSVADNIAAGSPGATRAQVEAAARDAFAHEFIMNLPKGYDTRVGERGVTLSGGQRQRVAIARAFVRNAPILVLDEATAALDSRSEAEVQRAIDHLAENRTVLCIAHRLATLKKMDAIIVLDHGRIVERGTFRELLGRGERFADMAARQSMVSVEPAGR